MVGDVVVFRWVRAWVKVGAWVSVRQVVMGHAEHELVGNRPGGVLVGMG